ncbi:Ferric iron ABC transporter, permease protein [Castellaniella defragrans 65Phen]|uniref:Ferric iron ABC transporter, permease protein n=1 Tax=Castellaniella defragrans (strain DSM 12143 / CCUG 39792 / 65Phen) TaxID=1437824 RepID=W8X4R1_CASD6|nr:Ferric iron ABC transporter, permease protein [Castellaniella defragrans 65Phen]
MARRDARAAGGRFQTWPWHAGTALAALGVLAPVLALVGQAGAGAGGHWSHLLRFVLPDALAQTLGLLAGVGLLAAALGVGAAWLVTAYEFPGRRILSWALLLPLAVPTYVVAYAYLDILHPIGPVQEALRALLGHASPRDFRLPDLRSLPGAIVLLAFVLYPYVYLTTRSMFASQAAHLMEAARLLGHGPWSAFRHVALPLARPAIAVGLCLVLLETLNDIGASEFLGVQTLTVALYTTWVTRSDLAGAAQIALVALALVTVLIAVERHGRRRLRYTGARRAAPIRPRRLRGAAGWLAALLGLAPVVAGFAAPAAYLLALALERLGGGQGPSPALLRAAEQTLTVSALATAATVAIGLVVAWSRRILPRAAAWRRALPRLATLGYALPGTVLAIGLLFPLMAVERGLAALRAGAGLDPAGLVLLGTPTALALAYVIRFLAIPVGTLEAGLDRIPPSLDQAARLLGENVHGTLRRVHLPLLRPALAASALLVFVDAMKELPATLLLRPLNFDTLATWLYAEAARGTYEEGAIAALGIVAAGLLPVILLARLMDRPAA